jgi:hypothetical protein
MGCQRLIIQADCQEVVETTNEGGGSSTAAHAIYQDVAIQACSFDKVNYVFCPRDCNFVAHYLAREVGDQPGVWIEDPTSFIVHHLVNGVTIIFFK